MAIKLVTAKKKNGDILHFRTQIAAVEGLSGELEGKQSQLTAGQLDAVNSGITAEKVEGMAGYAAKDYVEGLGTVHIVPNGNDLSGFKDNDLIIELDD